jgi:phage host-nuclease inhibitor protein Gam
LEDLAAKRVVEVAQANKNVELESVISAQAQKFVELEEAYTNLKLEKENVTTGYRRLSEKHKRLGKKIEQEKAETAEAHATELARVKDELAKETQEYTDYRLNVRHRLRNLHEVLVASFGEVKARCFPFPTKNAPIESYINWFAEEVKAVPGTVWQLNNNFVILAIECVLNMLCRASCQELPKLRELVASNNASVIKDIPVEV